jgi:hypothetical protein
VKTAREFMQHIADNLDSLADEDVAALIEARDAEIRAEEHEARTALFALERAAHKRELREATAKALRRAGDE